jgi:hypothetical protein
LTLFDARSLARFRPGKLDQIKAPTRKPTRLLSSSSATEFFLRPSRTAKTIAATKKKKPHKTPTMSGAGAGGAPLAPPPPRPRPHPHHHDHDHGAACGCALRPQPLQQSLGELEFERSACKAALDGDVARLRAIGGGARPHLLDEASGGAGLVPLHYACRAGRLEAARWLLARAPWRAFCLSAGRATPLHKAAACGHAAIAATLLDGCGGGGGGGGGGEAREDRARALALAADDDGATALHLACASGRREAAALLLARCPEAARVRDGRGRTPRDRWREQRQQKQQQQRGWGAEDDDGDLPWPPD